MNDHEPVVAVVVEKGLTNPAQIVLRLLLQLDPGPDSGMYKQIISEAAAIDKAFEERDVLLRDRFAD